VKGIGGSGMLFSFILVAPQKMIGMGLALQPVLGFICD